MCQIRHIILLLFGVLAVTSNATLGIAETFGYCTFTRQDAIECFRKYVDTNHDEAISISELRVAKKKFTPYSLQAAGWIASKFHMDTSIRTTVKNCRAKPFPANGVLAKEITFTPDDFMKTKKSCLPTQWAMCQLKKVCDNAANQ
jgi:hypothetical protein